MDQSTILPPAGPALIWGMTAGPAYPHGAQLRVTILVLITLPLVALALLGIRFADAQRLVDMQSEQQQRQDAAQLRAMQVAQAVDAQARRRADAALAAWLEGGALRLRTHYLSDPAIEMVALFDPSGNRLFPEAAESSLFAENRQLAQVELRLDDLRRAAQTGGVSWAGSLSEPNSPAMACHNAAQSTVCLLLRLTALRQLAEDAAAPDLLADLGALPTAPAGMAQAVAPLAAPFAGFAVVSPYRPTAARSLSTVALLLAPTLLGSLIAVGFAVRAHRAQIRLAQQRIDLLSGFSHDLRTPLANLRLYASLLRKPDLSPHKLTRYADIIEAESAQLSGRVDHILAEATKHGPAPGLRWINPDQLVVDLLERYRPAFANAAQPVLDLRSPGPALFDAIAFERVLLNLLDNARKHAAGAQPLIATTAQGGWIRLTVSDGGGADPALPSHPNAGFGLGLRSCRAIARRAGGRFQDVISVHGSRFCLELPDHGVTDTGDRQGDRDASADRRG